VPQSLAPRAHAQGRTSTSRDDIMGLACMSATKRRLACAVSAPAGSGAPGAGGAPAPSGARNACAAARAMSRSDSTLYASSATKSAPRKSETPPMLQQLGALCAAALRAESSLVVDVPAGTLPATMRSEATCSHVSRS
jgi:hypothetical protein